MKEYDLTTKHRKDTKAVQTFIFIKFVLFVTSFEKWGGAGCVDRQCFGERFITNGRPEVVTPECFNRGSSPKFPLDSR
jgi:hypothetical protein